jgi:hypothetical protein
MARGHVTSGLIGAAVVTVVAAGWQVEVVVEVEVVDTMAVAAQVVDSGAGAGVARGGTAQVERGGAVVIE